ncbi:MAG TPA: hypothetical protein VJB08_01870 [Candidatus Nanoarchaeia archaeon]|nr:hypothetical protein [Candidatus Nanoarchaeia archaeon]
MDKEIRMTFQVLFEIVRNERTREELQELAESYFDDVAEYLSQKYEILLSKHADDVFSLPEKEKTQKELINIRRVVKEIYERRQKKVMRMAMDKAKAPANIVDTSRFLKDERELFDKVMKLLEEHRGTVLEVALQGKKVGKGTDQENNPRTNPETTTVKFTQPVAQFVGTELEIYGPFEPEQTASLPNKIADILVNNGSAEAVKE